jgi:predicted hotdog family 3-hydroxylacyl-ACP dehydratase
MNPSDFKILDLIPQRPPMQMIDALVFADEKSARGILSISEENLFYAQGRLSESALVEFIAQTAAAFTGYRNKINQAEVTEGYIGALKNLVIYAQPPLNSELTCEIEVINEIVGFTIIQGKVYCSGKIIADCEMRILPAPRIHP